MVYGANCEEAESLRDKIANTGALRVLPLPVRRSDRMPILPEASPESFCKSPRPAVRPCFLAGDFRRVNENPGKNLWDNISPAIHQEDVSLIYTNSVVVVSETE